MYLFVFIAIAFISVIDLKGILSQNLRKGIYFLFFLIFWLLAGLRYETGVDWPGYTSFFENSESPLEAISFFLNGFYEFELGYTLLNSFVRKFTSNVQWLFLWVSFITSILLFKSIPKYSNSIFLSLLIYFSVIYFILDMSGIRQCIALNIFFYSIQYIIKRDYTKYFCFIFLASLFHTTALVLIPMYFVLMKNFKNYFLLILSFFGLLISLLKISWISIVLEKIIGAFFIAAITGKLYGYGNREDVRSFGLGFLLNIIILVFLIFNRKSVKNQELFNVFLNMYVVGLFFYYFTWELTEFSSRLRLYFIISNIALFPIILDTYKQMWKKYLVMTFAFCFSFFYCMPYILGMKDVISYVPYQNYLIHVIFGLESTGEERLRMFSNEVE